MQLLFVGDMLINTQYLSGVHARTRIIDNEEVVELSFSAKIPTTHELSWFFPVRENGSGTTFKNRLLASIGENLAHQTNDVITSEQILRQIQYLRPLKEETDL